MTGLLLFLLCWFLTTLLLCGTIIYLQFKMVDLESAVKKLSEALDESCGKK